MTDTKRSKPRRRGHNEGTGYQRSDGRWEWKITLPNGKRKSFYGDKQASARKAAQDWLKDQEAGLTAANPKQTVGEFLEEWYSTVAVNRVRERTQISYRGHIDLYLKPHLGHIPLRELSGQHVNAMMATLIKQKKSPSTVNLIRATLRTALTTARKWGKVAVNAAANADSRRVVRKRITPLTRAQAIRLLDHVKDTRMGPVIHVTAHTGMRSGEVRGLRWRDVDLKAGEIHVRTGASIKDGKPALTDLKTEESRRTIGIGPVVIEALKRQREIVNEMRMLAADRWQELDLVFPSTIGTIMDDSNLTHRFQVYLEELKLPHQRFHDLRHLAASELIGEGGDLIDVKEMLGHSQITLTANTYAHLTQKQRRRTADRMNRAFASGSDDKVDDKTDDVDDDTG